MKALLTKIAIRKAVGLYLGEHDVTAGKMVSTPVGPIVVASSSEPCTPDNLGEVIERLLVPLVGRKRRVPVAVGLATSRLFFGTRLTSNNGEAKPEAELRKALCSSNLAEDDLVVDLLRGSMNKVPVARMAACRTKYMTSVVAILSRLGVRPFRAEPAPWALVRLAARQNRAPLRSKTVLRIFLGAAHGLAVVVVNGLPLIWKTFALPAGPEAFAILSAAQGLKIQQAHYEIESVPNFVMIHGRTDLHERLQKEQLPSELGTRVLWHEGPALDGASMAFGLALGCLAQDTPAFDLSRSLKARPPIKEIFPWGELVFTAVLMGGMAGVLGAHAVKLDETQVALQAENSQHVCLASAQPDRLEKDKKAMAEKIEAVRTFLESRIQWTAYARDFSERLPANAQLSVFTGRNPLAIGEKAKATPGFFELQGTAPLAADGSMPRDIDAFLRELSKDPLWKRDFESVVTDIKLPLGGMKEQPKVDFSITCVCKEKAAATSPKGADKDKAASKEAK